ncbi:rhodanese-like protein [Leptospira ryugenii]|uniref:Rhodanese-like protein n=1 Tax=Leptospira ryugenii TaxID=1917863 RepID=A0A2P2DVP5_9LEPT|nr:rhodanese-like domain-containing protein [Leptospira ryugenii]GBF48708.1 rhodanese-like protein [Leptospira ryugenii]
MRYIVLLSLFLVTFGATHGEKKRKTSKIQKKTQIQNPLINYNDFQKIVDTSNVEREKHRLTEDQFLKMMSDPETIILDARSELRYKMLHVKGAVNLPFTEFTEKSLQKVVPNKKTKILIYCNNNFEGSPEAFAAKAPAASLNLSTYTSLKAYGYESIFELGPLLDIKSTKIPFEGNGSSPDEELNHSK